jgi:signal transduction histidine kinase
LHPVEARLARWLLAIHDRIDGNTFVVPQELIADMLGVHRPTVSLALQRLEDQGAITRCGRAIVIANRAALESRSCECHQIIDRELDRLLVPPAAAPESLPSVGAPSSAHTANAVGALEAMREIAGRLLLASIREQEALERAEEANRVKDQFLATVSHELRQPLNVILVWCATLSAHKDQSAEHGLEVIARNAGAQLKLIEDLLDAARVTAGTLTTQPTAIALPDIVQDVVDEIKPTAEEKHVVLQLTATDALPSVFADADRLRQVLSNILTNALKFTDPGGSVDVDVRVAPRADWAQVTVRDTGRGIAASVLPHVFERFRQGSATDAGRQGLGLGLPIARALIELQGGTIDIDSAGENQGTTCTIELPLFDARQESDKGPETVRH